MLQDVVPDVQVDDSNADDIVANIPDITANNPNDDDVSNDANSANIAIESNQSLLLDEAEAIGTSKSVEVADSADLSNDAHNTAKNNKTVVTADGKYLLTSLKSRQL